MTQTRSITARFAALALPCVFALAHAGDAPYAVDVPFVTTPDNVTLAMLELAGVGPTDFVIDLGSGDGRIPILAAKRFGARALGVEIDPALVARSKVNARLAGVEGRVQFREQDLFFTDLKPASVITMYLLPEVNLRLRPALLKLKPGTRVVSHDWDMGEWKPDRTLVVAAPDKPVGIDKKSRVHLWIVPARVEGLWCSGTSALQIAQKFQRFDAELVEPGAERRSFSGRIEGGSLRAAGATPIAELELRGEQLHVAELRDGNFAPSALAFSRATGALCR